MQGRPLYVVRLGTPGPNKPEVFIVSVHHAREWVAAEMGIRLLEYLPAQYAAGNPRIVDLLERVDVILHVMIVGGGMDPTTGAPYDVIGSDFLSGLRFSLNGGSGADNQVLATDFVPTGLVLDDYDQTLAASYDSPGTEPTSGVTFAYTQQANNAYKRLGGRFTVPVDNPTLTFSAYYEIEVDWDYAFVEVARAGQGDWTTLPEVGGATVNDTGDSCPADWVEEIHPFLANYQNESCEPTGATGEWHGLTGTSRGFETLTFDLSAYAGQEVELYISYASDFAVQELGLLVDDIQLGNGPVESFEAGFGAWTPAPPPTGSPNANNWVRTTADEILIETGPVVTSNVSVYFGFGFEAIADADDRVDVMSRVLNYLGVIE